MHGYDAQSCEESVRKTGLTIEELRARMTSMPTRELEDYELSTRPAGFDGDMAFSGDAAYMLTRLMIVSELFQRPDSTFYKSHSYKASLL